MPGKVRKKDKYDREYDMGKLKKARTHKAMNFNEDRNSFSSLLFESIGIL